MYWHQYVFSSPSWVGRTPHIIQQWGGGLHPHGFSTAKRGAHKKRQRTHQSVAAVNSILARLAVEAVVDERSAAVCKPDSPLGSRAAPRPRVSRGLPSLPRFCSYRPPSFQRSVPLVAMLRHRCCSGYGRYALPKHFGHRLLGSIERQEIINNTPQGRILRR